MDKGAAKRQFPSVCDR